MKHNVCPATVVLIWCFYDIYISTMMMIIFQVNSVAVK